MVVMNGDDGCVVVVVSGAFSVVVMDGDSRAPWKWLGSGGEARSLVEVVV